MARAEGARSVPQGGRPCMGGAPTLSQLLVFQDVTDRKMFLERISGVPPLPWYVSVETPCRRGKLPGMRQTIDGSEPIKGTRRCMAWARAWRWGEGRPVPESALRTGGEQSQPSDIT